MVSEEAEIEFILKILRISDDKKDPVGTVTQLGFLTYMEHPDSRVRNAMHVYMNHPRRKPIVQIRRFAAA